MSSLLDPYIPLLVYLGAWAGIFLLGVVLRVEKHGIIVKPYYVMLKTVVFNSWMERLGRRWRRAWLAFFNIGAALGLGLLVFVVYAFARNAFSLIYRTPQAAPTLLILPLPGLTISWEIFPYILISIAVLLIPHEVAHGIASVLDKVPLKSSGVFLALFLPGGFVEIDEEDLAKRATRTKLRVFAAGSSTNVATWFLVILLFANFAVVISPLYHSSPSGVLITGLVDGGAAQQEGIEQWSVITSINNVRVTRVQDLASILAGVSPGDQVIVETANGGTYSLKTQPAGGSSSRAVIGIFPFDYYAPRFSILPVALPFYFWNTFSWMSLILLGVALVNMLPLYPFDGDRYFDTILNHLGIKDTKRIRIIAGFVSLGLLGSNLILSYALFGTVFPR